MMGSVMSIDGYSFPSGHTTRVVMLALFAWRVSNHVRLRIWSVFWAALVSISRVLMGRHHVADIVAGALIGACTLYIHDVSLAMQDPAAVSIQDDMRRMLPFFPFTIRLDTLQLS